MSPDVAKALELAEAARRHLQQALRSKHQFTKQDHEAAADELLLAQVRLLRSAA